MSRYWREASGPSRARVFQGKGERESLQEDSESWHGLDSIKRSGLGALTESGTEQPGLMSPGKVPAGQQRLEVWVGQSLPLL